MKLAGYTINFEEVYDSIIKNKYENILIQLPEGLKQYSSLLKKELEKKIQANIYFSADPCYGACDLPYFDQLGSLDIQVIIHIGHTAIPSMNKLLKSYEIPVYFLPALSDIDIHSIVDRACKQLDGKNIGIVTTAQHIHKLKEVEQILFANGFQPIIQKGTDRIAYCGQILGCNFSAAKSSFTNIDSYLYVGGGIFHPLGLLLATKKQVIIADPFENKVKKQELIDIKDKILRQRFAAITLAKDAESFGIIFCTKYGQQRRKIADNMKQLLKDNNKQSITLVFDFISPLSLQNYLDVDCFISTACPRIAIDDYSLYKKPIITPLELEIALGKKSFDDYCFDEIEE